MVEKYFLSTENSFLGMNKEKSFLFRIARNNLRH